MRTATARAGLLVILGAWVTAPGAAQLRMPKLKNPLARVTGSDPAAPKTGAVTFDDDVLEITAVRLASLADGLRAEQAMAARVDAQDLDAIIRADSIADAKHARDLAAFDAAQARRDACVRQHVGAPAATPGPGELQQLEAVATRVRAAQARGDMAEVMRLTDSLARVGQRAGQAAVAASGDAQQRVQSACGSAPARPVAPGRSPVLSYTDITQAGQQASGLTTRQYRILRERVAPVILGVPPGDLVYTSAELDAITDARPSLDPYRDVMRRF